MDPFLGLHMGNPKISKPRRALFIIPQDAPGGAERVATILANTLAKRCHWEVEFWTLSRRGNPSFVTSEVNPSVCRRYGPFKSPICGILYFFPSLSTRRFDFVFSTHVLTNAALAAVRSVRLTHIKRLVTRESTTIFDRYLGFRRTAYKLLYRVYGSQDLLVAQTRYMAEHVSAYINDGARAKLVVLGNPVDIGNIASKVAFPLDPEIKGQLSSRTNVLVCGRLIPIKQPSLALEAFRQARLQSSENLQLVFMGDGEERASLETLVRASDLEKHVVFLGQQANPYAVMRACQYGLITSSREGFPNVLLEMMACGMRKIVTTPCAGDLDSLTGVKITTGFSAEELATALVEAIASKADYSQLYQAFVMDRAAESYLSSILGERQGMNVPAARQSNRQAR